MDVKIIPRKLKGVIDIIPSKSHAHRVLIARKLSEIQRGGFGTALGAGGDGRAACRYGGVSFRNDREQRVGRSAERQSPVDCHGYAVSVAAVGDSPDARGGSRGVGKLRVTTKRSARRLPADRGGGAWHRALVRSVPVAFVCVRMCIATGRNDIKKTVCL